jgi:catechol 2,3-dioxygenase-like lactoylglutathione lyase family enzyme
MATRLEHANICVRNIDAMIRFLETAFPEFHVRGGATNNDGTRWIHVGIDETYIALTQSRVEPDKRWKPYQGVPGVNHLGYEIDDVEALRKRMTAAGYRESTLPNAHPFRRRVYFYDPEGNDWEFVQYLSDDPAKRNDYKLPDR